MLCLQQLQITHLRNISNAMLNFHPKVNLLQGENASGKTSLLEAIYLLSYGRSFRTHLPRRIIQNNQDQLILHAKLLSNHVEHKLGLSKSLQQGSNIKIDGKEQTNIISNLRLMPIQLINTDSFSLLFSASKVRRAFIDWGMFHVKHDFLIAWNEFNKLLKQRNALLRQNADQSNFKVWDPMLVKASIQLDAYRKAYCLDLEKIFQQYKLLHKDIEDINIVYKSGWNQDKSFEQCLNDNYETDVMKGYTVSGPHRADIDIRLNGKPAKDQLSRGQLKLLLATLYMAQSALLKKQANVDSILLIDDITAELDRARLKSFIHHLLDLDLQIFITMVDQPSIPFINDIASYNMFHVEHGTFNPVQ
jgi:DNA replication and repair protein RecF